MFFNNKAKKQTPAHTQHFKTTHFDASFDDISGKYLITSYMKVYELSEDLMRDLDAWAQQQKDAFENRGRLSKLLPGVDLSAIAKNTGSQFPLIGDWFAGLNKETQKSIVVTDLNKVERKQELSESQRKKIYSDSEFYLPTFGESWDQDKQQLILLLEENGVRYYSPNIQGAKDSITNNFREQLYNDQTIRPTLSNWYKSLGVMNGLGVKTEKFREPQEMDLEIDLKRYSF